MDTARYIRITNLCMLFFRAEGIAFSLYDKQDTCHTCSTRRSRSAARLHCLLPVTLHGRWTSAPPPAMQAMRPSACGAAGG